MRRDDDVELGLRPGLLVRPKRLPNDRNVAKQRHLGFGRQILILGKAADDERIAVANSRSGFRLPLADGRITLAEAGDARHDAIDVARYIAVGADPRRDLEG